MTEADRITLRTQCLQDRRWRFAVRRRLRESMVEAAMGVLIAASDARASPMSDSDLGELMYLAAQGAAESSGYGSVWVSIGLWLFSTFVLPKLMAWWRNRRSELLALEAEQ